MLLLHSGDGKAEVERQAKDFARIVMFGTMVQAMSC